MGDSFVKANQFEIERYSAVAAVGGDGTLYDVANGILSRPDKKKLPTIHIPNGSGNAFAMGFRIMNVERALEAIKKGHVVKTDTMKCYLDFDSEDEIRKAGADPLKHIFYSQLGVSMGFIAKVVSRTTARMKQILGPLAYFLVIYKLIQTQEKMKMDIDLDNGRQVFKDFEGSMFDCYNIQDTIGAIIFSPATYVNDGLLEFRMVKEGYNSISDFEVEHNLMKAGGLNSYRDEAFRFKTLKLMNRNYDPEGYLEPQVVTLDGEPQYFTHSKWKSKRVPLR